MVNARAVAVDQMTSIFLQHDLGWRLVAKNHQVDGAVRLNDDIKLLLAENQPSHLALRSFLQHRYPGRVYLDFGVINGRQWCAITIGHSTAEEAKGFPDKLLVKLKQCSNSLDLNLLVDQFNAPVILVNCMTGSKVPNQYWLERERVLSKAQAKQLHLAIKQLCVSTPQNNNYLGLDNEQGLILLCQYGQTIGAWRLMLWFKSDGQDVPLGCLHPTLSNAEKTVCDCLQKGMSPQQIANFLNKSVHTVRTQMRHIYRKLGVNSLRDLLLKLEVTPQVLK